MDPGAATRRHKHQWILGLIALSAAALAAIVLYALPHCIPADKLKRVTPGASREEVVSLLGQPASTTQYSDKRVRISYRKHSDIAPWISFLTRLNMLLEFFMITDSFSARRAYISE